MSLSAISIMHAGANSNRASAAFSKVTNGGVHAVKDAS
jgi:hypothetical protein